MKGSEFVVGHFSVQGKDLHGFIQGTGNAGDTLLVACVRQFFSQVVLSDRTTIWTSHNVRAVPTESTLLSGVPCDLHGGHMIIGSERVEAVSQAETRAHDAVIVGGGGLFLPDSNVNERSGWQWPITKEQIELIPVPLLLYAIGYNRFPGQAPNVEPFAANLATLMRTSRFVGMRHHGDIRALREQYPDCGVEELQFAPCPTTVLQHLYPDLLCGKGLPVWGATSLKRMAINVALDRLNYRLKERSSTELLVTLAQVARWAVTQGWEVYAVAHCRQDREFFKVLNEMSVKYVEADLVFADAHSIIKFYRDMPLTLCMRGHSQMIPFGVGNAIVSLLSHDKLRFFLEDIGHAEWGVELNTKENLLQAIIAKVEELQKTRSNVHQHLQKAQKMLWEISLSHVSCLRDGLLCK